MAKVSEQAKKKYSEKVNEYKSAISKLLEEEKKGSLKLVKGNLEHNLDRIRLAEKNISLISYYTLLNSYSVSLLGIKHETGLNNARKCCYKSLIYLEEAVSRYLDVPFSDYEEPLQSIEGYGDVGKYNLLRKLGLSIALIEKGFGDNSKWKWSFVDIKGRYAIIVKNMINFKTYLSKMDPREAGYRERTEHIRLAKEQLSSAADSHREKYELSTRRIDDIQLAVNFVSALRRMHIILGENNDAEIAKKKIDIWKNKMEADIKEQKKLKREA